MSNPQLKFASLNDAIQHLSDVTGKKVKIAWRDESKEIMQNIVDEIRGKPGLVKKFNNYIKDSLEPGMKVRSSNSGKLYVVDDVEEALMNKMLDSISKAPAKEVFDIVQKDKKSFPKFHETYDKGLQEQDGFYRGKGNLIQRGKDFLTGEKGQQSEEDERASTEEKKDEQKLLSSIKKMAKKRAAKLPDTNAKDSFIEFFDAPGHKGLRDMFVKEFSDGIDEKEISVEDAQEYEKILKAFMSRLEKDLSKEMPKFVDTMEKLTAKIVKEVDQVEKEAPKEKSGLELPTQEEVKKYGAIDEKVIDNVISVWAEKNIKGE